MTQEPPPKESRIVDEFRELGENLIHIMRTAWESPERKRLQQDITNGLNELSTTMRTEAQKLNESETAQKIRTGEMETRIREEVLSALRTVNTELERAAQRMSRDRETTGTTPNPAGGEGKGWEPGESVGQASTQAPEGPNPSGHYEVNPDDTGKPGPDTQHQEVNPDDMG